MTNLDGTDKIVPTPFDAHEQIVREPHTHELPESVEHLMSGESGYQPTEYEHREYPKAVAHTNDGEPILVNNAEEEKAYGEALKADTENA
jgi:murein tripeptide amidase MpaA